MKYDYKIMKINYGQTLNAKMSFGYTLTRTLCRGLIRVEPKTANIKTHPSAMNNYFQ